jgi:hypothetical protein
VYGADPTSAGDQRGHVGNARRYRSLWALPHFLRSHNDQLGYTAGPRDAVPQLPFLIDRVFKRSKDLPAIRNDPGLGGKV